MSFDEYVHHISQKYRLAVAISVIKTKPNNVSVEEYLLQLQNKIKDLEFDPNETVCSDDFKFDDDDVPCEISQPNLHVDKSKTDYSANEARLDCSVNENDSQCSQTILRDYIFDDGIAPDAGRESTIGDTIRLLKEVAAVQEKSDNNHNLSQLTFCESQETTNNDITYCNTNDNSCIQNKNLNKDHIDSQETELYTVHGFTQNTHVSQTQGEYFVTSDKYIRGNASNIQDTAKYINVQNANDMQMHVISKNLFIQNDVVDTVDRDAIGNINMSQHQIIYANNAGFTNAQSFQFKNVTSACVSDDITEKNYSKTTEIVIDELSHADNGNCSQTFQFNIHNEFGRDFTNDHITNNINKDTNKLISGINMTHNTKDVGNTDIDSNTPILYCHNEKARTDNEIAYNNDDRHYATCNDNQDFAQSTIENDMHSQQPKDTNTNVENDKMDVDETESDDNLQERVPFKVLEELNRVKSYLNRKDRDRRSNDGYSTDSGYRSDSQSRSSLKSVSQACGAWLNQSAYCLFSYLVQTAGADDIDKEIAQALGQLIDKLHEEENYPQFLEEMLGSIDGLLDDVHEGVCGENVLITKDENIQRLILLNKSKHILKHSIEKITNILEKLHTNLTQENLYELTNITEVENTSYIFHILEIFLRKYVKIKDVSSTQNSQEDFPKRSSLTELWRKKWNPNCKEIVRNENKTCVLKRCRDVLNKIIVECMDGYSLVAFAALQCFNLIQI